MMNQEIKILISMMSKLDMGVAYNPHAHPYYQLDHIVSGRYTYTVDGRTFTAGVGDTVLIPANCVHSFTETGDVTGYYYEVKFSSFSKGVMEMCADVGYLVKDDDLSGKLLQDIIDERNNATPESEEIMINYLYTILFRLSAKARREKNTPSKYIEVSAYSPPVRDTIRFLEDNYRKRLTLDDIASQTPIQKEYLCNLFKKETTVTIFECLMIIRIRKAVELISYTDMSLEKISKETGFANVTHFNRVFTKHVMIPPGKYRRELKSQDLHEGDAIVNPIAAATHEGKKIDFPNISLGS